MPLAVEIGVAKCGRKNGTFDVYVDASKIAKQILKSLMYTLKGVDWARCHVGHFLEERTLCATPASRRRRGYLASTLCVLNCYGGHCSGKESRI
jgi:hypothetical protein